MNRIIAAILAVFMILSLVSLLPLQASASPTDLRESVEQQIRTQVKNINQKDAVNSAAATLAVHGMTMNGKDLVLDESNALSAVLFNSKLMVEGLTSFFVDTLEAIQLLDMQKIPSLFLCFDWYESEHSYDATVMIGSLEQPSNRDWLLTDAWLAGTPNNYDIALEWMVAHCTGTAEIRCSADSGNVKTYRMTVTMKDKFDFSIANTSGFKQFMSGLGMLLFQEFEWRATVSFELTVPYSYDHCSHSSGAYHWTYDPENCAMLSDGCGEYTQNDATRRSYVTNTGNTEYYYALENTVRLRHDKPWVLEYTTTLPRSIALCPIEEADAKTYPALVHSSNQGFYALSKEYAIAPGQYSKEDPCYSYHNIGTQFEPTAGYSYQYPHTFRLENMVAADGSNMLYLTATRQDTGEILFERVPLNEHLYWGPWMEEAQLISDCSTLLNGQDFYINFIGSKVRPFNADTFELRIWEDGIGEEGESYIETVTVAPTCAAEGYTARVCPKCGLTEKLSVTEKLPHEYAEKVIAPSCTAEGYTSYTCKTCGDSYKTNTTEKTPHSYSNFVSNNDATCAHDGTKTGKCTVCGEKVTVVDEGTALPHTWADATCQTAKTCKVCGATEGEALGHDLKFYNAKAPTCTNVGWNAYEKCQRCNHSTFARLSALGHDYRNGICTRCGDRDGSIVPGEVTGDGKIDMADAYQILLYLTGKIELSQAQLASADVSGDGSIDLADACQVILLYTERLS